MKKNKEKGWLRKGYRINDFYAEDVNAHSAATIKHKLAMKKTSANRKISYRLRLYYEEKI